MVIKSNSSEQEVSGGGIKLYSGRKFQCNYKILQCQSYMLLVNVKSEPNYYVEFSGEEYFKLTFWVKNEDLTTRMEILMK